MDNIQFSKTYFRALNLLDLVLDHFMLYGRWIADVETPQALVIDLMCTHALVNHINILWEVRQALFP